MTKQYRRVINFPTRYTGKKKNILHSKVVLYTLAHINIIIKKNVGKKYIIYILDFRIG